MSTDMTWQTVSTSSDATEKLAEQIGRKLKGGEVIELISDLGGGKTTFVRGLVRGMGSHDKVSSPTFTLSKIYKAKNLEVQHFDFYRLSDPGIVAHEINEVAGDPGIVTVIEWGNIVNEAIPGKRLKVEIKHASNDDRGLTFIYPEELKYLVENL